MEHTLLLNVTYEPLRVISWQKAITLLTLGKVEVVEEYDREIHSVSFSIQLPSVVRLLYLVKRRQQEVKFSRRNIYARDGGKCQYCGVSLHPKEITYDHVLPKSKGGDTSWKNVVTCCVSCNSRKGNRTPEQAHMTLLKQPGKPRWTHFLRLNVGVRHTPESWRDYLYWNIKLESGD
jgi:5-methylcytosine-specific restriction endonuclease McrA